MTFTVVARCPVTEALGVCMATGAIAVASRCPTVVGGVAALSSQSHTDWRLGILALALAREGVPPVHILSALREVDSQFDYRQVGIVSIRGQVGVHSGVNGADYTGHIVGSDFLVMGNTLAGKHVLESMFRNYTADADIIFEEKLLRTVEAGRNAGGDRNGQMSSCLVVAGPARSKPLVDLRVDMAQLSPVNTGDAVTDLRQVFNAYRPLIRYYSDYWPDHPEVSADGWLTSRENNE